MSKKCFINSIHYYTQSSLLTDTVDEELWLRREVEIYSVVQKRDVNTTSGNVGYHQQTTLLVAKPENW